MKESLSDLTELASRVIPLAIVSMVVGGMAAIPSASVIAVFILGFSFVWLAYIGRLIFRDAMDEKKRGEE